MQLKMRTNVDKTNTKSSRLHKKNMRLIMGNFVVLHGAVVEIMHDSSYIRMYMSYIDIFK